MEFQLSSEEYTILRQMQRKEKHNRRYKKITVLLSLHNGFDISEIEEILGLDDNTIRRYLKQYKSVPLEDYLGNSYEGRKGLLSFEQEEVLGEHLDQNLYGQVKPIIKYVESEYGVSYSESGMTKLLHRLGFEYKQTKTIPSKADEEAQCKFIEEKLKPILKEVEEGQAELYYADGCHPTHNTNTGRGWIRRGQEFEVKSNSGRQRVNINAAVNAFKPEHLVYETTDSINAQSTQRICRKLLKKHPRKKVYIICDNAGYSRNKMLSKWAENQRIELEYLPPYSPNLNLIERLWRMMRKHVITSIYHETYSKFKEALSGFLDNLKEHKNEARKLMTLNFRTVGGTSYHAQF